MQDADSGNMGIGSEETSNMKRLFITAALAGTMIAAGIPVVAQTATDSQNTTTQAQNEGHHHHRNRLAYMSKQLNLTQEQQSQLKPIFQKQHQAAKAMKEDTSLTQDQKKAKFKSLRQETMAQVNPILTPEQQQQWAQLREQAKARHQKNNEGQSTTTNPQG
jgi:periplasmic protein CpxP/Spy